MHSYFGGCEYFLKPQTFKITFKCLTNVDRLGIGKEGCLTYGLSSKVLKLKILSLVAIAIET
jgi:hypothetical protein